MRRGSGNEGTNVGELERTELISIPGDVKSSREADDGVERSSVGDGSSERRGEGWRNESSGTKSREGRTKGLTRIRRVSDHDGSDLESGSIDDLLDDRASKYGKQHLKNQVRQKTKSRRRERDVR